MKVHDHRIIYQSELASIWFDEQGFLCLLSKTLKPTLPRVKATYALIRQIAGDKKVCLLSDSSSSRILDDESRKYIAVEIPKLFEAVAIVSTKALGKVNAVIFLNTQKQQVPLCTFSDESEARAWLMKYL